MSRTDEIKTEIRRVYSGGPVVAFDPDAATPGAALWSPELSRAWSWGGNSTGAALVDPVAVETFFGAHDPGLVVIEAPLPGRSAWSGSMHAQNMVRGGLAWVARLAGCPVVMLPPGVWEPAICGPQRGAGSYKKAYKAHASRLLGRKVNEDAAAALCMLEFALRALGHELPAEISSGVP